MRLPPTILLLSAFLSAAGLAQTPSKPADPFRNEALVFERSETTYRMHADGTGEREAHVLLRVQSEGAARQFVLASQQMSGDGKLAVLNNGINATKFPELVPPGSHAHLLRSAVVSCSMGTICELVLVPHSTLQTEQP